MGTIEQETVDQSEGSNESENEISEEENVNQPAEQPKLNKGGRPLKRNAHQRSNKNLEDRTGRRSKAELKVLKLRLDREHENNK